MKKSSSAEIVTIVEEEHPLPIRVTGKESQSELLDIVQQYDRINRGQQLELMQQRDVIIGLEHEIANLRIKLNETIVAHTLKTVEYNRIKQRLKRFDNLTETFLWRGVRRLFKRSKPSDTNA